MDNQSSNIKSKYCQIHNQPFLYCDKDGKNPQCESCLLQTVELITIEEIQKQYLEKIIHYNKENDLQIQQLHTLRDRLLKYKENIIVSLNKSIQQITDQIDSIQSQKKSTQQLDRITNQHESILDFTNYLNSNLQSNRQQRNQILINLLYDLKQKFRNVDFLEIKNKGVSKIEYQMTQQVKSKLWIYDFVIDYRTNTLTAGLSGGIIKIYDFQNGKVGTEIQSLNAHTNSVFCLYRMKKTLSFVSGSGDKSIIIWYFDQDNKWQVQQTLNNHTNTITCIIMNQNEDLLISSSFDQTVKFWSLSDSWNLSQTIDVGSSGYALSLNDIEDKLIACTHKNQIIVMRTQKHQKWKIVQAIQVNEFGYRLCFTIEDQFVFQPITSDQLEVYDYDRSQEQFYQITKVQVQRVEDCTYLFPCQFLQNLNILIVKHGYFVNIFKVNWNGKYQLIQTIKYQHHYLYGKLTDDGEYLITQDGGSNEIQVRKLKF